MVLGICQTGSGTISVTAKTLHCRQQLLFNWGLPWSFLEIQVDYSARMIRRRFGIETSINHHQPNLQVFSSTISTAAGFRVYGLGFCSV